MARLSYIVVDVLESFKSFDDLAAVLRRIKQLGYDGAELHLMKPSGVDVDALLGLTETLDLPIVSFMTGASYFSEGLCLSSPNADVRQRAVERLKWATEIGARFGAVLVVGQMQGFSSDEPNRDIANARIEECLKQVAEAAEKHRTTIVMEPVNHLQTSFHNTSAEVMALTERINSPYIKPMLDSFHINIEEASLTEPIHRVGSEELRHFHLCESNGGFLGSGHIDCKAIFEALAAINYDGYISLKIYRQPFEAGAVNGVEYLRKLQLMD
jgi:5-keto-L-gluconate epimerase